LVIAQITKYSYDIYVKNSVPHTLPFLGEVTEAHVRAVKLLPLAEVEYQFRYAVRAVLLNKQGNVGVLYVKRDGYHKLPGGGAEETPTGELEEDSVILKREVKEETGYDIEILDGLGHVLERKETAKMRQISACYLTRTVGEPQPVALTEREAASGMELEWMPIDRAIATFEKDAPEWYRGKMILLRDLLFLRKGREVLEDIVMRQQAQ
jgi:8-oxo-dGTP diphosphatase